MKILERLGLSPMPKMETIEQAEQAYLYYQSYSNKKRQCLALRRWNALCLPIIEITAAAGDMEGLFNTLSSIRIPPEGKAYNLACQMIKNVLPKIATPKQAHKYFLMSCNQRIPINYELRERWENLSRETISKVTTFEEMKVLIDDVFLKEDKSEEEEIYRVAILKWAELANTLGEIEEVIKYNSKAKYSNCSSYSTYQRLISRAESILYFEIPKINDIKTIKYCYHCLVSKTGTAKLMAFERWLDLCTTPEQANEAFGAASEEKCRIMAYNKAKQLISAPAQTT